MRDYMQFIQDRRIDDLYFNEKAYKAELEKWDRQGECKRCGNCCTALGLITSPLQANKLQKAESIKENNPLLYRIIEKIKCPHLIMIEGKARCKVYDYRPDFCRDFPEVPDDLVDGCGFYFVEKDKIK